MISSPLRSSGLPTCLRDIFLNDVIPAESSCDAHPPIASAPARKARQRFRSIVEIPTCVCAADARVVYYPARSLTAPRHDLKTVARLRRCLSVPAKTRIPRANDPGLRGYAQTRREGDCAGAPTGRTTC